MRSTSVRLISRSVNQYFVERAAMNCQAYTKNVRCLEVLSIGSVRTVDRCGVVRGVSEGVRSRTAMH